VHVLPEELINEGVSLLGGDHRLLSPPSASLLPLARRALLPLLAARHRPPPETGRWVPIDRRQIHKSGRPSRSENEGITQDQDGFAKQGKRHFKIALGSAAEAATILDLLPGLEGAAETQQKLRRIGAMLRVLSR